MSKEHAEKHFLAEGMDKIVKDWLDARCNIALANAPTPEAKKAIENLRHVHLDDYWYTLTPRLATYVQNVETEAI